MLLQKKMIDKEISNLKAIDTLIRQEQPFAVYRIPGEDTPRLLTQASGSVRLLYDLKDLDGARGFVIAPFRASESCPIVLIQPEQWGQPLPLGEYAEEELEAFRLRQGRETFSEACTEEYEACFRTFIEALRSKQFDKLVLSICVAEHLVPFLPGHGLFGNAANEVAAAPFGSAGILPITYGYIRMMGAEGLARATQTAILNANYLAACFKDTYGIVYRGANGFVGHEMILECRKVHEETGISENDIAKRLMDYGYHAPTLSFPVHGTLMIEPTESESLAELDNFVHVMLAIWQEIQEVKNGEADKTDNVLVNAPHPEYEVVADTWEHSYTRQKAAYPYRLYKSV